MEVAWTAQLIEDTASAATPLRWRSLLEVLIREPAPTKPPSEALWSLLIGIIFVLEVAWIWFLVYLLLRWFR
jgi:hypothetical protein